jgi:hypothetical protein
MDPQASELKDALQSMQQTQTQLLATIEALSSKLDSVIQPSSFPEHSPSGAVVAADNREVSRVELGAPADGSTKPDATPTPDSASQAQRSGFTSRIILTTYPKQIGINPIPLQWGSPDVQKRGPVVVLRTPSTLRRRNAVGAHGGSYSIYYALAVASKELDADHKPDFTNTEPTAQIGPFPQWGDPKKIVAMDPWGHLAPWIFKDIIGKENIDVRPTIAITKAHMKLPELEESVKSGRL